LTSSTLERSPLSSLGWSSLRGSNVAFLAYLVTGTLVLLFLFATVHRRSTAQISVFSPRYHKVVQVWIEHGYFKHGGLAFTEPGDANPRQTVWRSSSMGFLLAAQLVERMSYLLRGRYTYRRFRPHFPMRLHTISA
jgi:hypothetical protein